DDGLDGPASVRGPHDALHRAVSRAPSRDADVPRTSTLQPGDSRHRTLDALDELFEAPGLRKRAPIRAPAGAQIAAAEHAARRRLHPLLANGFVPVEVDDHIERAAGPELEILRHDHLPHRRGAVPALVGTNPRVRGPAR